jgi:PPP family 3-phenylpropionic acid transporter
MTTESQFPGGAQSSGRRFAVGVGLFYATTLGIIGVYLPFFPVWLKAVGVEASLIGIITALPSLSRFTVLPFVTALAERHQVLRGAIVFMAFATALGFAAIGVLHQPVAILILFALTACVWTPLGPMTDGYTLKGVARYGLDYGPLRLWGSAAFVVGALGCGLLAGVIAAPHLIWVIVGVTVLSAFVSLGLQPLDAPPVVATAALSRANALLRQPLFLAIIGTAALVQGSHAAYYTFASITWQDAGLDGMTIAALWSLGVIAEIVVFALSPRFSGSPVVLVMIGAAGAALRWMITAQEPPIAVLAVVQLMHGLSYGMTHIGTIGLLVRSVPHHVLASAQGYLVASIGVVTTITMVLSGLIYAQVGQGVYYLMAAMAGAGLLLIGVARQKLDASSAVAG